MTVIRSGWGERSWPLSDRGSNTRPFNWEADTLPLSYRRPVCVSARNNRANGGFVGKETLAFYKSLFAAPEVGTSHVDNLWALINFANQLWLPHYCSGQLIMWHSVHVKPNSPSAPWFVNTRDRPKLRRSICPKRLYAGWLVSDLPENELIWNSRMKYRVWIKALENNLFFF